MQDLSFVPKGPSLTVGGLSFSLEVFSFENLYILPPDAVCEQTDGRAVLRADSLRWAGGQETAGGQARLTVTGGEKCMTACVEAGIGGQTVRCVKLAIDQVPCGEVVSFIDQTPRPVDEEGILARYPEGWRSAVTPVIVLRLADGSYLYFMSLDNRVREKRFALMKRGDSLRVELIFEEAAVSMGPHVKVPDWKIGRADTIEEIYEPLRRHVERSYGLKPFEEREDAPAWLREISLVLAVHCQHWTGYIFNTYDDVLRSVQWVCRHIEGRRVLLYLPGFEGRYYWKYGGYSTDPRMGGDEGFRRLVDGAHALGVHVMPMFGINTANRGLPNFEQWGAPSEFVTPSGGRFYGSVDWDGSRHYDHNSNASLNPAAPGWQNRLVEQITGLAQAFGFDAAFLDIAAVWVNDARHELYPGILRLVRRLREHNPDFLVAGEAWYDGLAAALPLVHSGHTDGRMHYHDEPYAPLFDTYCREFSHLCLGDVSRGSTGAHELGTNPERTTPYRRGLLQTLTVVDGTLEKAPEKALAIIETAKRYAAEFLESAHRQS